MRGKQLEALDHTIVEQPLWVCFVMDQMADAAKVRVLLVSFDDPGGHIR